MDKYIESAKLEKIITDGLNSGKFGHDAVEILSEIYALENSDVTPVVHGKWKRVDTFTGGGGIVATDSKCSICGRRVFEHSRYCPNCGAKMDLED